MPDIQGGLVHMVKKGRCGNCGKDREAHAGESCLFDFTTYREENVNDHMDCTCESVIEEDTADIVEGKAMLKLTSKKPLSFIPIQVFVV